MLKAAFCRIELQSNYGQAHQPAVQHSCTTLRDELESRYGCGWLCAPVVHSKPSTNDSHANVRTSAAGTTHQPSECIIRKNGHRLDCATLRSTVSNPYSICISTAQININRTHLLIHIDIGLRSPVRPPLCMPKVNDWTG